MKAENEPIFFAKLTLWYVCNEIETKVTLLNMSHVSKMTSIESKLKTDSNLSFQANLNVLLL